MVLKNQKPFNGKINIGDQLDTDRISDLPEPVLHHILSFLPIETAATTCILSKRWMFLWTCIPFLDFSSWSYDLYTLNNEQQSLYIARFIRFVEKTLHRHDTSNIKKFNLNCTSLSDFSSIKSWISILLRHKVEELVIRNAEGDVFPSCLFTCESLTRLELVSVKCVNLPKSIRLPRLKILKLNYVSFANSNDQLFSKACPVLEELSIKGCDWKKNKNMINISSTSLKHFTCYAQSVPLIKIWAPNLVFLSHQGSVANFDGVHTLSSLIEARIHVEICDFTDDEEMTAEKVAAIKILRQLYDVKHLSIFTSGAGLEFCLPDDSINLPTFSNLTHMEFHLDFVCPTDKDVINLLQNLPKLESLMIHKVSSYIEAEELLIETSGDDDGDSILDTTPQSLVPNLKSVGFRFFEGQRREICLVNFFLKNAFVLQTMSIEQAFCSSNYFRYFLSAAKTSKCELENVENQYKLMERKMKVMSEILEFPRSSSSCVIRFK